MELYSKGYRAIFTWALYYFDLRLLLVEYHEGKVPVRAQSQTHHTTGHYQGNTFYREKTYKYSASRGDMLVNHIGSFCILTSNTSY
jgi:hypothetical protein